MVLLKKKRLADFPASRFSLDVCVGLDSCPSIKISRARGFLVAGRFLGRSLLFLFFRDVLGVHFGLIPMQHEVGFGDRKPPGCL